ncbi:MAG: 7-cyano-7-deazaguanine tRNA-ribosyltransferase [Thermoplasmata archaeon]|jgi:queuine/archaeosine tRNA-ribosyltransferase|nr:7-cyano-7-deazaguanine tRNA-ribosyltransferase [Thermoplasmata archaeon]
MGGTQAEAADAPVAFFPVVHLLTGPPGLARNGGVWKLVKRHLASVSDAPRVMVQCLHFTTYNLSLAAWDDWCEDHGDATRLAHEIRQTFGERRDVFVDSGGFQLLHADKMDLSKWGLEVKPEHILELQAKYRPQRLASLDSPIGPKVGPADAQRLRKVSIGNAAWLAKHTDSIGFRTRAYAVVHGRNPDEVAAYLKRLEAALPKGWLKRDDVGIALGSQVPLASRPEMVAANANKVLAWLDRKAGDDVPFHAFGIGEGVTGRIAAGLRKPRAVSFDNSSWVQKAFRMRVFDPETMRWQEYDPHQRLACACAACHRLEQLEPDFVHELMTKPAYRPSAKAGERVNRSDILALVGLHNLGSWRLRLEIPPARMRARAPTTAPTIQAPAATTYDFPVRQYKPRSENLLILGCSKTRPYKDSRTHRLVLQQLADEGLLEGRDFDRITLSGLYGPVHWTHESHPAIMAYDFQLGRLVSDIHRNQLKLRTANVLNVIHKKYARSIAYLPNKPYMNVFGPVVQSFSDNVVDDLAQVPRLMVKAT